MCWQPLSRTLLWCCVYAWIGTVLGQAKSVPEFGVGWGLAYQGTYVTADDP